MFDWLFGCSHRKTTFPQTQVSRSGRRGETRVTCLECGAAFSYDWAAMKRGARIEDERIEAPLVAKETAA